jgi:ABC-type transport system involved in cytochrome c biogenesis permease subunit
MRKSSDAVGGSFFAVHRSGSGVDEEWPFPSRFGDASAEIAEGGFVGCTIGVDIVPFVEPIVGFGVVLPSLVGFLADGFVQGHFAIAEVQTASLATGTEGVTDGGGVFTEGDAVEGGGGAAAIGGGADDAVASIGCRGVFATIVFLLQHHIGPAKAFVLPLGGDFRRLDQKVFRLATAFGFHNIACHASIAFDHVRIGNHRIAGLGPLPLKGVEISSGVCSGGKNLSYFQVWQKRQLLRRVLHSPAEDSSAAPLKACASPLGTAIDQWSRYFGKYPPALLPSSHGKEWESPWAFLSQGHGEPERLQLLSHWHNLATAFRAKDASAANQAIAGLSHQLEAFDYPHRELAWETQYNSLDPFGRTKILLTLAIISFFAGLAVWRKGFFRLALGLVVAAALLSGWGLILRYLISHRPPVTNLYETFVFVAWTCLVLGLVGERFLRDGTGTLGAALSGWALLMISGRYSADGDTIRPLVAVLDSNFWLATHVITISLGYAGCCFSGLFGHIFFFQRLRKDCPASKLEQSSRVVYGTLAFGLVFTFVGTVLGGIWADQSWGRFWGWDPKENGALLIVLWTSIVLHARLGDLIRRIGVAAGAILSVVVVMLAWFGVNLLGVGLHAYGFTSGVAMGLAVFTLLEIIFLAIVVPMAHRRELVDQKG